MTIDLKMIKFVLSMEYLIKVLLGGVLLSICFTILLYLSIEKRYTIEKEKYIALIEDNRQKIQNPEDLDNDKASTKIAFKRCSLINCHMIYLFNVDNNLVANMKQHNPKFVPADDKDYRNRHMLFYGMYTKEGSLIIKYNNQIYLVDDLLYFNSILNLTYILAVILGLLYVLFVIYMAMVLYKNSVYEKGAYKMYVENKLQRDVTEMIHHEMNMPIAIIRGMIDDIHDIVNNDLCKRNVLNVNDKFDNMELALQRIESVLQLLQEAKHIKYNYTNISIFKILENIIACINSFSLSKLKVSYEGKNNMLKYTTDITLPPGSLLNIINVMVTNSKEAKALNIHFKAEVTKPGYMDLFIKDDGMGIRDKYNRIIKTSRIFEWGYSSKDDKGNHVLNKSRIIRFLNFLGINIENKTHLRGIGLYVNRAILRKIGGDIILLETSETGTLFQIVLPIRELTNE